MITVLLVEGPRLIRQGLRALLAAEGDVRVVGEAADGRGALALAARHRPAALLVVARRPARDDLPDLLRGLARRSPRSRAIVLAPAAEARAIEALRPGFVTALSEDSDAAELLRALRDPAAGRPHPGAATAAGPARAAVAQDHEPADPLGPLTIREREVFFLAAEGLTSAAVAERLFISRRTVEAHRANLMRKLGLRNQTALVRFAIRGDLLPPEEWV